MVETRTFSLYLFRDFQHKMGEQSYFFNYFLQTGDTNYSPASDHTICFGVHVCVLARISQNRQCVNNLRVG